MTDDELKETVMDKLGLTEPWNLVEWEDLRTLMREKAKGLRWMPLFDPLHEPNGYVY